MYHLGRMFDGNSGVILEEDNLGLWKGVKFVFSIQSRLRLEYTRHMATFLYSLPDQNSRFVGPNRGLAMPYRPCSRRTPPVDGSNTRDKALQPGITRNTCLYSADILPWTGGD